MIPSSAKPLDRSPGQVDTDYGRLEYTVFGQAQDDVVPLVLLLRTRGASSPWDESFITGLAVYRQVICFAGACDSSMQPEQIVGMKEVALAFIRAVGLTKADVLGWSTDGLMAERFDRTSTPMFQPLTLAAES